MADLNDFGYTDDLDDVMAVYVNRLLGSTMRSEYKNVETLAADKTLADSDTPIQRLDCNGAARIVKVPTADAVENHPFFIVNSSAAAYAITLKTNDAAAIIATISQGESALVLPDGNGTYQLIGRERETAYKMTPTVAANNLTLTLTHMDGTTPSTSRPLWFRIGDAWRAVTGALAVTVNAAVNTFNAGSAELATKEVDYFGYVSWRAASSAVVLGFGRIPFASLYSDFSGTATDNKYAAFSTAPASGDDVVNIGRFAATLSAGAGYTWTVPTFDNSNLRHVPTFETRWLTWIPTISGYSANPTDTVFIYRLNGRMCEMNFREATAGTSNNATHTYTAPFTAATRTNMVWSGGTFVPLDNSANVANGTVSLGSASNSISFQLSARAGHTASGSSRIQWANMAFEV